ncbi:mitochondrial ribonuclease P catalytic subunit isoform X1 [Dunckerocampus dactyliophorus]|uniref:mitochondrial ribonuclease P catalytic subunit isoform X1 n=1 Tax=Dunckerocampus dactyliophorus TaxID=161453 RepID=UPI002405D528|nr:mitochondrial ribonuclease P catalytic subunit isoform X1 [Dunckerocampus dactyliophorus]
MGSTVIFQLKKCLMTALPVINQGSSVAPVLPYATHILCYRGFYSNRGWRRPSKGNTIQANVHGGLKNSTIRQRTVELRGEVTDGRGKNYIPQQNASIPKSVFAAGTAKKTAEMLKRKAGSSSEEDQRPAELARRMNRGDGKLSPPDKPLSVEEWKKLKESLGSPARFDIQMLSALLHNAAELDIAKSLLTFAATESGTLSYELLLRYLTLCVNGNHDTEVFDVYDIMRVSFPSLDTGACSLFIRSFSRTARWKEALSIVHYLKKVVTPSPGNYGHIIAAAMLNGDLITAWALYDELMAKGLNPQQGTWACLFKRVCTEEVATMSLSQQQERLLGILLYLRNNQVYPQRSLASSIKTWFESIPGQHWRGTWSSASPKGMCKSCGTELESIQLTAEEYQELRERVMTDIIQGQDVFNKTTPEELDRFKAFVRRKPAFDVVVDGLNVANVNNNRSKLSETLLAVVSELKLQGLTILVLGRKHMLRPSRSWDKHNMKLIQEKAHCFFTDNISEDDPFLLYATLHSGNHCRFVSRDLMRDHKACLPDEATRRLFFKWQRGHQLVVHSRVSVGRRVQFQSIPSYDTIVQTTGDTWHIPYDDTDVRSSYEVPQKWLCLTKIH